MLVRSGGEVKHFHQLRVPLLDWFVISSKIRENKTAIGVLSFTCTTIFITPTTRREKIVYRCTRRVSIFPLYLFVFFRFVSLAQVGRLSEL